MGLWSKIKSFFSGSNEITVNDIQVIDRFQFDPVDEGDTITLKKDAHVQLEITRYADINKKGRKKHKAIMEIHFGTGFKTNGASVPKKFRREMPAYIAMDDKYAHIYNAAAFIHDGLYACKGIIEETGKNNSSNRKERYTLTRDECDDILRGIWRESRFVDRFKAAIGDLGVGLFAGGSEHWGNDDQKCSALFKVTIAYKD